MTMTLSRIQHMTPPTAANLTNFLEQIRKFGSYSLMPAQFPVYGSGSPAIESKFAILKRHLHVRPAWQMAENDMDCMALDSAEGPYITGRNRRRAGDQGDGLAQEAAKHPVETKSVESSHSSCSQLR